ncbi:MAG: hypothetical protein ACOVNR_03565 [Chitinophagaceae bacterium]
MKKILVIFTILLCSKSTVFAQVMAQKAQWVTITSANLKCWTCKEKLEKYLISENESTMESGILQRKYNLVKGEIRIQFLPDRVSVDVIKTVINNAGFDADAELAEPEAYKKLPPICKREADGGGPKPGKPCHVAPL